MIKISTKFPDAIGSADYYNPIGAIQDNHSNSAYLGELKRLAGSDKFSYLDLACAGGQSVVDVYELGNIACGVEGSDLQKMLSSDRWSPTYLGGNDIKSGAKNWKKYKDICLFKADITKEFELINKNDEIQLFDIITAWDFLEHPLPTQIPMTIDNIKKHLSKNGAFVCLISKDHGAGIYHRCIRDREWWIGQFEEKGLVDVGFDFNASPRHTCSPTSGNTDMGFIFKHK